MKKILKFSLILLTLFPLTSCNSSYQELKYLETVTPGLEYKFSEHNSYENILKDTNYYKINVNKYEIFISNDMTNRYVFENNRLIKFITLNPNHGLYNVHIGDNTVTDYAPNDYIVEGRLNFATDFAGIVNFNNSYLGKRGYSDVFSNSYNLINLEEANLYNIYNDYYNLSKTVISNLSNTNVSNKNTNANYTYNGKIFLTLITKGNLRVLKAFSIEII